MAGSQKRLTLVGAYERHNFGDWLLAHTADALTREVFEVHWVNVLGRLGVGMGTEAGPYLSLWDAAEAQSDVPIIHVGGETLACDLSSAIRMSWLPEASPTFDPKMVLPIGRTLAYVTPAAERILDRQVRWGPRAFFGVGGRTLDSSSPGVRGELYEALESARWLSVRDPLTRNLLTDLGLDPQLHPDLVTALPGLLGRTETDGSILVQVSSALIDQWGATLAAVLGSMAEDFEVLRIGIAGIAPHHDRIRDAVALVDLVNELAPRGWAQVAWDVDPLRIAESIGSARLIVASSLHYRVLATGFGTPAVSIGVEKSIAYSEHWDLLPAGALEPADLESATRECLEVPRADRIEHAARLEQQVLKNWARALEAIT